MYLINGKIEATLSIRDRGLAYGDGLFETIAIINKQAHNWDLHFERLVDGAKRLQIKMPEEKFLLEGLNLLAHSLIDINFILKIILTRGEGGKGYQCPPNHPSHWMMMSNPWPAYPDNYYKNGINVEQLDFQLSIQPTLAGIKHLNRLEQVIARQELSNHCQEALLCNTDKFLIEGISSNLYFVTNNILYTPSLDKSGINGTIRRQIISLCKEYTIQFQIADFKIESLYNCDAVFYSNSIIGLWPVKKINFKGNKKSKNLKQGPIFKKLSGIINKQLQRPF
jgi:4-amino-4-deoxychorismate lyase